MRKIGMNMNAKAGMDFGSYVDLVKSLGFEAMFSGGVPTPEDAYARADKLAAAGLEWETMHAPFSAVNEMWKAGEAGDAFLAKLKDGVDRCALVNVPIMVTHLSSGIHYPAPTDIGRGRYTELVEYATAKGVKIAFENLRSLANLAWTMEEFRDSENVGFCWDCGHESCFTPGLEFMPLFGKRLICTHIHDNHGPVAAAGQIPDQHLLPFDGAIDFARIARQIRESGYQGTLMLEALDGNSDYYRDITCEEYLTRAAEAVKKLRDMAE